MEKAENRYQVTARGLNEKQMQVITAFFRAYLSEECEYEVKRERVKTNERVQRRGRAVSGGA